MLMYQNNQFSVKLHQKRECWYIPGKPVRKVDTSTESTSSFTKIEIVYQHEPEATSRKPMENCWYINKINFKLHNNRLSMYQYKPETSSREPEEK